MESIPLWHLPIVFLAGLIGEGYGTVIGSGGILIQFLLVFLGIPLQQVVATDIAGSIGANVGIISASGASPWHNKKLLVLLTIPLFAGDVAGALFLTQTTAAVLRVIIIVALVAILVVQFLHRKESQTPLESVSIGRQRYPPFAAMLVALGWYGNTVGVGSGTFSKLLLSSILRIRMVNSIAVGQIIALPGAIVFLIIASLDGLLVWPYMFMLWLGSFVGSRAVTAHIRKIPDHYLKRLLIAVTVFYLLYLLVNH